MIDTMTNSDFICLLKDYPSTDQEEIFNEAAHRITKLERERDEARQKYDILATEHMLEINRLCNERDEARAERDLLKLNAQTEAEHHDRMVGELERLCDGNSKLERERDEAREELGIAVGLLSTHPQFAKKHPEDVLAFVKEGGK